MSFTDADIFDIDWTSLGMSEQCDEDDETCGKHSGIPQCCRDWFARVWKDICYEPEMDNSDFEDAPDYLDYIPCPGCRATGAFVKIKPCPQRSH